MTTLWWRTWHVSNASKSAVHVHRALAAALCACILAGLGTGVAQVAAGDALVDAGDYEGAIAAYEAVLAANGDDVGALTQLARARVYLADSLSTDARDEREALYAAALEAAERAVGIDPNEPDAHFEISRALGRTAQYRGVLNALGLAGRVKSALDTTLELDPTYAAAWHATALFHRDVPWIAGGRKAQVVPSFEEAIRLEPDVITHRVELARFLADEGDVAGAKAQLDAALGFSVTTYREELDLEEARSLRATLD